MSAFPDDLRSYQDFFNYEAERILDLPKEELEERIKAYNKLMYAVKIFEHATTRRLIDIAGEEKESVLKKDFNYIPDAPPVKAKKVPGEKISKEEKSIRKMMDLFGCSREEAEQIVAANKK